MVRQYYGSLAWEPGVLWQSVFEGMPNGVADLARYGLHGSRNSVATGQTGTSSIITTYGIDQLRIGRDSDAAPTGLIFESTKGNPVANNTDFNAATWFHNGTIVVPGAETGPDGVAGSATVLQTNAGASAGAYQSTFLSTFGSFAMGSVWVKRSTSAGGSGNSQIMLADSGVTVASKANLTVVGQAWIRQIVPFASPAALALYLAENADRSAIGGGIPGATSNAYFLPQWETGRFVSEAVVNTTNGTATRAGERLWHPAVESLRQGQTFTVSILFRPKGGSSDYGVNPKIWSHNNVTTFVEWDRTTSVLRFVIGDVTYTTPVAMTWAAGQTIEVVVAVNAGSPVYAAYRILGGTWVKLTTGSPPTLTLGALTGDIDFLGDRNSGAGSTPGRQLSSWIYNIRAWRAGQRPAGAPA